MADQNEAMACLAKQGGLDTCNLSFYQQGDIGKDGVWDNWRLEGPSLSGISEAAHMFMFGLMSLIILPSSLMPRVNF